MKLVGIFLASVCFSMLHTLVPGAVDLLSLLSNSVDFLEVEGLDEGEKLVFGVLNCVVDETIREEN